MDEGARRENAPLKEGEGSACSCEEHWQAREWLSGLNPESMGTQAIGVWKCSVCQNHWEIKLSSGKMRLGASCWEGSWRFKAAREKKVPGLRLKRLGEEALEVDLGEGSWFFRRKSEISMFQELGEESFAKGKTGAELKEWAQEAGVSGKWEGMERSGGDEPRWEGLTLREGDKIFFRGAPKELEIWSRWVETGKAR